MCNIHIPYKDEPFSGIVNFFNNVPYHEFTEFMNVEAYKYNDTQNDWGFPITIINYSITGTSNLDQWVSPNNKDQAYFNLSFKYPIYITNYTLKTRSGTVLENLPKGWNVSCIFHNKEFVIADSQKDQNLNISRQQTYKIQNPMICQNIQVKMTEKYSDKWHFHVSRIEFFGDIILLSKNYLCPPITQCIILNERYFYHLFSIFLLNS